MAVFTPPTQNCTLPSNIGYLIILNLVAILTLSSAKQKKTKHFLFIYLGQMVYSHFLDFSHVFVKGLAVLERSEGLFRRADTT